MFWHKSKITVSTLCKSLSRITLDITLEALRNSFEEECSVAHSCCTHFHVRCGPSFVLKPYPLGPLVETMSRTCAFGADIQQLTCFIMNTSCSDRALFLHDLICNLAGAVDKIIYECTGTVKGPVEEMHILHLKSNSGFDVKAPSTVQLEDKHV